MSEYMQQLERVKRFLRRIEDQNRNQIEYEDDLWSFFQNCWHLKDWIKNDICVPQVVRNKIENKVRESQSLNITADLCNRSKHLYLKPKSRRVDADIKSMDVKVHVQTLTVNSQTGETTGGEGRSEYNYTVSTEDGSKFNALDLARHAVQDWEHLIAELNI